MKVILQQDIAQLGKKNEEVNVSNGYALNRLIPNGMAVLADTANKDRVARYVEKNAQRIEDQQSQLQEVTAALKSAPLLVAMPVTEQGTLFQALHVSAIVAAAGERGVKLLAEMVELPTEPIKSTGSHTVVLRAGDQSEEIVVEVVAATE